MQEVVAATAQSIPEICDLHVEGYVWKMSTPKDDSIENMFGRNACKGSVTGRNVGFLGADTRIEGDVGAVEAGCSCSPLPNHDAP